MVGYAGNLISFHDRREDAREPERLPIYRFIGGPADRCVRHQLHHRSARCGRLTGLVFREIDARDRNSSRIVASAESGVRSTN